MKVSVRALFLLGSAGVAMWYGVKAASYCYSEYRGWKEDTKLAQQGRSYVCRRPPRGLPMAEPVFWPRKNCSYGRNSMGII